MSLNPKTELPVYYDDIKGWIVLTEETLSIPMLKSLQSYVYKVNEQRSKSLTGDKKKRVIHALSRLQKEGISVVSNKRGMTLFQSTEKVNPDKTYHFMGGK